MSYIFVGKFLRRCQRERLLLLNRLTGEHGLPNAIDRIDRINGSGSSCFEGRANGFQVPQKFCLIAPSEGTRALSDAVGGSGANSASAANDHIFDGQRRLPEVKRWNYLEFVRQEPLLDEQDSIVTGVKCYCSEMTDPAM